MATTLIRNAFVADENRTVKASVLIRDEIIAGIYTDELPQADVTIDARGCYLLPGAIDDHVHFRDPGLTHKADMASESRAAAAGGVTTVFDMPNCKPLTVTEQALKDKFSIARDKCLVNHSFYLGATRDNLDLVESVDPRTVCGIKLFMGSSTGGMLLDDAESLRSLFRTARIPVAVHCEQTSIINSNMEHYTALTGGEPPVSYHPLIRSEEACYASTSMALDVAAGTGVRLHIMHISTARELELFGKGPLKDKQFTAEACPAHLWFTDQDYGKLGTLIKCNPAVKTVADREALRAALTSGVIDVVGTDHAPHLLSEKEGGCKSAASGMPMLPYSLPVMLELTEQGVLSIQDVVRLMCNNPAVLFGIRDRGFIRQGYKADLALVSHEPWTSAPDNNPSKCGWSPLYGQQFSWKVCSTWVNGHMVYNNGQFNDSQMGQPVEFLRS